ncbi:MAG: hypothetical protein ACJ746_12900 [Bryobacteraceae bacterium]
MRSRLLSILLFSVALALQAQTEMNVQQVVDFIRSELALKQHTDKQIAAYVKKLKLSEKITDKTILDLEAQGAGPKTVAALQELRDEGASLKPPSHDATYSPATAPDNATTGGPSTVRLNSRAAEIPPPDSVRQQQILSQIKDYALSYTKNLPNFICVEVIRRYVDPTSGDHYQSIGNVLARVSYNQGQELYKVYSVNGRVEDTSIENAAASGGAISQGEFGSMMREIFEDKSAATFGWDHWATLRGRRMAVFNYAIGSGRSAYSISYSSGPGDEQRIYTAYRGLIYADQDTGEIARITFEAVDIPQSFPVRQASEILDYDLVDINGQQYVTPRTARLFMTAGREKTKNELEFRNYRKFGTESAITYDINPTAPAPPPLPESKEEPATASPTNTSGTENSKKPDASKATDSNRTSNPWAIPTAPPPPPSFKPPPQ